MELEISPYIIIVVKGKMFIDPLLQNIKKTYDWANKRLGIADTKCDS